MWWFGPEVLVTDDDHAGGKVSANSDHKENAESQILFFVLQEIAESQIFYVHPENDESQIFFVNQENAEGQILLFVLQEYAEIQLLLASRKMLKVKYCLCLLEKC